MRAQEVAELEDEISRKEAEASFLDKRIDVLLEGEKEIDDTVKSLDYAPEWKIPEPTSLMSAKSYMNKLVVPFVSKLKEFLKRILTGYIQAKANLVDMEKEYARLRRNYWNLNDYTERLKEENSALRSGIKNYGIIRRFLGPDKTNELIQQAKEAETKKQNRKSKELGR